MPNQTFYNLPKIKKEKVEEVSIQEFREYSIDFVQYGIAKKGEEK